VEKGLDEIRPTVLVVKIISVLPNITGQERCLTFSQRIDGVRGRGDLELAAFSDKPTPAAAELTDGSGLELLLELVETAAVAVDSLRDVSARRSAPVRLHAVPEKGVVPHLGGVVEDASLG